MSESEKHEMITYLSTVLNEASIVLSSNNKFDIQEFTRLLKYLLSSIGEETEWVTHSGGVEGHRTSKSGSDFQHTRLDKK